MTLHVDYREQQLIRILDVPHIVRNLCVGDILCDYGPGSQWIAERKTASDLARSIADGRWRDQVHRLRGVGCRVFFIIEGDLRATSFSHDSLLGAITNAELRQESSVIRTVDVHETAAVIRHLVAKAKAIEQRLPTELTSPVLGKRERSADRETCWLRALMCVPSISERIARKLLAEYGSLPAIQQGLRDTKTFKRVRLDDRACLGTARIKQLAYYLGDADARGVGEGGNEDS